MPQFSQHRLTGQSPWRQPAMLTGLFFNTSALILCTIWGFRAQPASSPSSTLQQQLQTTSTTTPPTHRTHRLGKSPSKKTQPQEHNPVQNTHKRRFSIFVRDTLPTKHKRKKRRRSRGRYIGRYWLTYYHLSQERNYKGRKKTTLYDRHCRPIARVSTKFSDNICVQGSGRLKDGRVLSYSKRCRCGRRCPTDGRVCYTTLNSKRFPWGRGARSSAMRPLRSLAVDPKRIRLGTSLYIPAWDGVYIPRMGGVGGFRHDGCFHANDVGGKIKGRHFDFFTGSRQMWKVLEKYMPTRSKMKVYRNARHCQRDTKRRRRFLANLNAQ